MKKRILSLLMAVVILFQVIPATIQTVVAEDGVMGIDVYDLEVGKQYRAVWDYSYETTVTIYKLDAEGDKVEAYPGQLLKESLPQDLIVTILEDGDYFVYVTNDDWPATCVDYRLVESVEVIILECIEPDEPEAPGPSQVSLTVNGEAVSRLVLDPGEKTYILTDLAGEIAQGAASYQWQLMSPDGEWVNIKDYFYPYAIISDALIKNAVNSEGVTYVRCLVSDGMQMLISDPMEVSMKNNAVSYFKMRSLAPTAASAGTGTEVGTDENAGISLASEEETRAGASAFQIAINYVFLHAENEDVNGTTAANTFTLTLSTASPFTGDIISPPVVGYRPYVETTGDTFEKDYAGKKLVSANTYHFNEQREEVHVTIYYVPKDDVSYRVRYFKQNLQNDEYTEWTTSYKTGTADTAVGSGHNPDTEAGFSPLAYDEKAIISSDGGTVIDVYYDRNYYLVKYDLGEGYGVMPSYVRYGTNVMLGNPTNPGYTFDGWQLTAVNGETDNLATTYPQYDVTAANSQINVAHNLTYTAKWKAATTSYTVIYWVENADDDEFSVAGYSEVTGVTPGTPVNARDDIPTAVLNSIDAEKAGLVYVDSISDKNVVVKGDGTSAVNVYYIRKLSTLSFWAKARCTLTLHTHTAACQSVCTQQAHTHTEACGVASQSCGKEEHMHTGECCSAIEHTHTSLCCSIPVHTQYDQHDASCCTLDTNTLLCGKEEHTHEWYCQMFGCSKEEHTHDNNCYHTHGDGNCICGKMHDHTSGCSCSITVHIHNNGNCNNGKCGKEQHFHTVSCYTYNCGKIEHAHSGTCFRGCTQVEHTAHNNTCNNTSGYSVVHAAMVKYGADTTSIWNSAPVYRWLLSQSSTRAYTTAPTMPATNLNTYGETLSGASNMYTIHFYERGTTNKIREDTVYYRSGGSSLGDEDYIDVPGFTFSSGDTSATNREFVVQYTRNSYEITFNDGEKEVYSKILPFEADISNVVNEFVLQTPSSKEEGSVKFVGWYTTPTCADGTEFDFAGQTMPINGVHLFAKWEPTTWSVKVYLDEAKSIDLYSDTVLFDAMIAEPNYAAKQNELEAYKNLIFNGWYYNDGGSDIRFDFNTMAIKRHYVIFAKWTSHVPVPFKVRYVIEQDGAYVDVADPTVGVALVGVTKSFTAKAGDELYAEYRKYLPTKRAQSMEIKSIAAENELVFVYQTVEKVTYTVKHVFCDPRLSPNPYEISYDIELLCNKDSFSGKLDIPFYTPGDKLQAQAEAAGVWNIITLLSPDAYHQELILAPDNSEDKNEIIFEWADRGVVFIYQVIHHFENDGETDANNPADYTATHYEEFLGTYDNKGNGTVSATAIEEQGFELNSELSDSEKTFHKDDASIGSPRVLNLYYSREVITYEVKYVTSEGITTETMTAKYKSEVTVNAKDIPGYAPKEESQSATITYGGQLIIFYYDPLEVIFTYQAVGGGSALPVQEKVRVGVTAVGSTPTPIEGYYFVGWYTDAACTTPVDSSWVGSDHTLRPVASEVDAGEAVTYYAKFELATLVISSRITANMPAMPDIVNGQSFIYLINGKEGTETADISLRVAVPYKNADGSYGSVTIIGLPLGTYDITVESDWSSWRYNTYTSDLGNYVFDGEETLTIISTLKSVDPGLNGGYYVTSDAHNS